MEPNKAVRITQFDVEAPEKFVEVVDVPTPTPGPGQVLMRVKLRPVNPSDDMSLRGVYPGFKPTTFPAIPGHEGMGVVAAVGEGVSLAIGTRAFILHGSQSLIGNGLYQRYIVTIPAAIIALPDAISDEAGAQLLVNPASVIGLIEDLGAPPGEYVLQTAAGSSLGKMLIQVAKVRQIKTINVVRRAEHVAALTALGADHVLCSTSPGFDLAAEVKRITGGKGAWGATTCVAGPVGDLVRAVRPGGVVLVYGAMGGSEVSCGLLDLIFSGAAVRGWWLSHFLGRKDDMGRKAVFGEIIKFMSSGVMTPEAGAIIFPLEKFCEALAAANAPGRTGKVLLSG